MSVLIKGGRIITGAEDYRGDVFAERGTIACIGESLDMPADSVIDATGRYVLPGAIDPHTHLDMPLGDLSTCDDFTSGTIAAAFGGTTTIIDFCIQQRGQPIQNALDTWHEKVERAGPVVDVGFHMAVTDLEVGQAPQDLMAVAEDGVTSYKLFMAYKDRVMVDDSTLFKTMQIAGEAGALVMVHAENGDAIDVLIRQALAAGRTAPKWHGATRPPETEGEATNRAIQLAHVADAPLYVVHVSCKEALDPIVVARQRGWRIWGETCTHYLIIDASALSAAGFEGAKYVYTPPPRRKADIERLWSGLARDELLVVSSDHAPLTFNGQKSLGKRNFAKIPNGAPGVEERLLMLHHFGVRERGLSMTRFVELVSTNPAKMFGLYPQKGTIAVGSDADVVIWDPDRAQTLASKTLHSNVDYSLFEGTQVVGGPELVLLRGEVIVDRGRLVAAPGTGRFVKRARWGERLEHGVRR